MKMRAMCVLTVLVGWISLVNGSTVGVYIDDHFNGPGLDGTEWNSSGNVAVDSSRVSLTDTSNNPAELSSKDAVFPAAGQTVKLTVNGFYTWEWSQVEKFGLLGSGDEIIIFQNRIGGLGTTGIRVDITKDGVTASRKIWNEGTQLSGDFEIQWSPASVVITKGGTAVFNSLTDAPDSGSWAIPTDSMGYYGLAYLNSQNQSADRIAMEVVPEPATLAILGLGVLGFIRRR
jgi:hypothetical protein